MRPLCYPAQGHPEDNFSQVLARPERLERPTPGSVVFRSGFDQIPETVGIRAVRGTFVRYDSRRSVVYSPIIACYAGLCLRGICGGYVLAASVFDPRRGLLLDQ